MARVGATLRKRNIANHTGKSDRAPSGSPAPLSGQVEDALIHKLGLPVDMLRIEPGQVQNGLSGTELLIGKQVTILGKSSFLTASPRLCPQDRLVSLERIGVSLETRLSRHWGLAGSVDPVRGCETSLASTSSPFQLGLDLFWEKR